MDDEIIKNKEEDADNNNDESELLAKELGIEDFTEESQKDNDNIGTESNSEEEIKEDENSEKLLAGKFSDETELEKGYQELENKFTEATQKLSAIEKIFAHDANGNIITDENGYPVLIKNNVTDENISEEKQSILSEDEIEQLQEKFEENPVETVKEMTAKITDKLIEEKLQEKFTPIINRLAEEDEVKLQKKIQSELSEMEKIPDFVEHKEEISKMFDKYPFVAEAEKPYEMAYRIYLAENIERYSKQAQQSGISMAMENIKSVENATPIKGVSPNQSKENKILTDEEKRIAASLGLTEEEFLEELDKK